MCKIYNKNYGRHRWVLGRRGVSHTTPVCGTGLRQQRTAGGSHFPTERFQNAPVEFECTPNNFVSQKAYFPYNITIFAI